MTSPALALLAAGVRMLVLALFFMGMVLPSSAEVRLVNPDFETRPTNMTAANTSFIELSAGVNTLPGWSYSGKVWYVNSSPNYSLPGNGHGIKLGENGRINQTFKPDRDQNAFYYVLGFTIGAEREECYNNLTAALNISVPGSSKVFFLLGNGFSSGSRELWESHAYYMGMWDGQSGSINLEIRSVANEAHSQANVSCWPVVDTFVIKKIGPPIWYSDDPNILSNGGFEVGPPFIRNSSHGIILEAEPDELLDEDMPLQQWSIIGRVKYIDSNHYFVPKGKAAIEFISGEASGIETTLGLTEGSTYVLEFLMGDANDSCVADFIVYAQVGNLINNFTMRSNGIGSYQKFSMTFKPEITGPGQFIPISITNQYRNGTGEELCGPVIDDVVVRLIPVQGFSAGDKMMLFSNIVIFFSLTFTFFILV